MDLHFAPFDRACEVTLLPGDLAVLMVGIAQRQATSTTARVQARLWAMADPRLFAPVHGAFHGAMAAQVAGWKREERIYRAVSVDLQAGTILPATDRDTELEGAAALRGTA